MLFKRGRTNWGIVIAGLLAGVAMSTVPLYEELVEPGIGSLLGLGVFIALALMIWFENQWAGLLVALMLALNISFPDNDTESTYRFVPVILLAGVYGRVLIKGKAWNGNREGFSKMNHVLLIMYFLTGIASIYVQRFHIDGLSSVLREFLVSVSIFAWLAGHRRQKYLLLEWMVVFSIGLWMVLVYSVFFNSEWGKGATMPFFINANYFSAVLSIALPFMFWLAWSRKDAWRWLGIVIGTSFLLGIVWFQSRGAWVGLAGGVVFFVWFISRNSRQRLAIAGFLLAGATTLVFWVANSDQLSNRQDPIEVSQLESILDTRTNFSNRERILRWKVALRLFQSHPIWGVQQGQYPRKFKFELEDMGEVAQISYWNGWSGGAHSEYLTRLAERGLPGTLLFLSYLIVVMVVLFRLIKNDILGRVWGGCLAFALGTWMTHGIFNDLSTSSSVWIPLMLIIGYILQMKPDAWPKKESEPLELTGQAI